MLMAQLIPIFATTGKLDFTDFSSCFLCEQFGNLPPLPLLLSYRSAWCVWLNVLPALQQVLLLLFSLSNPFSVGAWKRWWPVVQWSALWPHNKKVLGPILGLSVWSLHALPVVLSSSLLFSSLFGLPPTVWLSASLSALWWTVTLRWDRLQWLL